MPSSRPSRHARGAAARRAPVVTRISGIAVSGIAARFAVLLAACGGGPEPPPIIPPGPYVPGQSYFSRDSAIEYIAGDAPVIFSAPHGGALTPPEIATRTCGTTTTDLHTEELVRQLRVAFLDHTGRHPHVVINRLSRSKLDANRDVQEATCGDANATVAWVAWHGFLDVAKQAVTANGGKGWYVDVHGHGHAIQRLELGYDVPSATLGLSDAALDASPAVEAASSVRTLSRDDTSRSFSALLRGPTSLGALYAAEGFPAVPSVADPSPGGAPYFDGGFNVARYGCRDGGTLCGVQIEANLTGVRDSAASRARFAAATVRILERYLAEHWGIVLRP